MAHPTGKSFRFVRACDARFRSYDVSNLKSVGLHPDLLSFASRACIFDLPRIQESFPREIPKIDFQESFPSEISKRDFQERFPREIPKRYFQERFPREISKRYFQERIPRESPKRDFQERFPREIPKKDVQDKVNSPWHRSYFESGIAVNSKVKSNAIEVN